MAGSSQRDAESRGRIRAGTTPYRRNSSRETYRARNSAATWTGRYHSRIARDAGPAHPADDHSDAACTSPFRAASAMADEWDSVGPADRVEAEERRGAAGVVRSSSLMLLRRWPVVESASAVDAAVDAPAEKNPHDMIQDSRPAYPVDRQHRTSGKCARARPCKPSVKLSSKPSSDERKASGSASRDR